MKKIRNIAVVILFLVISVFSAVALVGCNKGGSSDETPTVNNNPIDNLEFVLQSDDTYGVKTSNKNIEGALVIPAEHNGKTVTVVLKEGFAFTTKLTSVEIPNSVKTIEKEAFYHSGLKNVTIYPTIEKFGLYAFGECHFNLIHKGTRSDFHYDSSNGNAWSSPTADYVTFIYEG